jgi:uncharacterized protein YqeY
MRLYEIIQQGYLTAFKAKEITRKDILGYLFAQLKSKQIDLQKELSDEEVIQLIKKEIKTRQEAIGYATSAGKTTDAALDTEKITILETYLPKQLSAEELTVLIRSTMQELGITDLMKQRGQLIGALMKNYSTQIEGKLLNECISLLS